MYNIFHAKMTHAEFSPTYVAFQVIDVDYDSCLHILKLIRGQEIILIFPKS